MCKKKKASQHKYKIATKLKKGLSYKQQRLTLFGEDGENGEP